MRHFIKYYLLVISTFWIQTSFAQDTSVIEFAQVSYNKGWHIIDRRGNTILKQAYGVRAYRSLCLTDKLAMSSDGKKFGFIDFSNKQVIPNQFDAVHCFVFGFAAVAKSEKWGIINRQGSFIVPPVYDYSGNFGLEWLAGVIKDNKVGFVDTTGNLVIPFKYFWLRPSSTIPDYPIFVHGLITVIDSIDEDNIYYGKAGCLNTKGELVIPTIYDYIGHFDEEGVASASKNGKIVLIDTLGNIVLEPKGVDYGSLYFENGYSLFYTKEGRAGIIKRTGEIILTPKYNGVNRFSEGFAAVQISGDEKGVTSAFIDTTGKFVFNRTFGFIRDFHEGLAAVEIDNKWGFIDTSGKIAIAPVFSDAQYFDGGLAIVGIKNGKRIKYGYIDRTGKFLLKPIYDEARPFEFGLAAVKIGKKFGFIDTTGKVIIEPRFDNAFGFQRERFGWLE